MDMLIVESNSEYDWGVSFETIRAKWLERESMDSSAIIDELREAADDMSTHDLYYWARDNLTFKDIEHHVVLLNEPTLPDYEDDWRTCFKRVHTFDEYCDGE